MDTKDMTQSPVNPELNVTLIASAGTGKTYNLSLRVLAILLKGVRPDSILCVTFTNKAVEEMHTRINGLISSFADKKYDDYKSEIETLKEVTGLTEEIISSRLSRIRENMFKGLGGIRIKTLSSFVNMILTLFPFEAGLRPGYEIQEDSEAEELFEIARAELFEVILATENWEGVVEGYEEALRLKHGDGADDISNNSAYLIGKDVPDSLLENIMLQPSEIMEKAELLKGLVEVILASAAGYGTRILGGKPNKNHTKRAQSFIDVANVEELAKKAHFANRDPMAGEFKSYEFADGMFEDYASICAMIEEYFILKDVLIKGTAATAALEFRKNLDEVKKQKNIITYADITAKGAKLLSEDLDLDSAHDRDYLYFRLDGKISHILIDEFQDTSAADWGILEPLVDEAMAGLGQNDEAGSYFCVGDPKQTLYRFRGGERRLFGYILDRYDEKIKKLSLQESYRSRQEVLDPVNKLFSALPEIEYDEISAVKGAGGYSRIFKVTKDEDRCDWALFQIKRLLDKGFRASDIAVLVGTNSKVNDMVGHFIKNGVDAVAESSGKLLDTAVFTCVYAAFSYLFRKDRISQYAFALSEPAIAEIKKDEMGKIAARLDSVAGKSEGKTAGEIFTLLNKEFALEKRFENSTGFGAAAEIIYGELSNEVSIISFLERFKKSASSKSVSSVCDKDAVTVMTIHKSKGLEFEAVILPELNIKTSLNGNNDKFVPVREEEGVSYVDMYKHVSKDYLAFASDAYLNAAEAENADIYIDKLNQLYVAMTRAVRVCLMCFCEAPTKDTLEEVLSVKIGEFESGDFEKLKPVEFKPEPVPVKSVFRFEPLEKNMKTLSPAGFSFYNSTVGEAAHSAVYFALLQAGRGDAFDSSYVYGKLNQQFGAYLGRNELERMCQYAETLLNSEKMKKLLAGQIYMEHRLKDEDGVCVPDFFAVMDNRVELVDFKTGEPNDEHMKKYQAQLDRYAVILNEMFGLKVVKSLCFLGVEKPLFIDM